jgi:cyanophycin synthetase
MRDFVNISQLLLEQMQRQPDALAVNHCSRKLTYGAFGMLMQRAAASLRECGVGVADVIGIALSDPLDHWLATLALSHIGAIAVSFPTAMADEQRENLIRLTRCARVLAGEDCPDRQGAGYQLLSWSRAIDVSMAPLETPAAVSKQPWLLAHGSGSTGRPKIIPITHQQQLQRLANGVNFLPFGRQDVLLSLVSMHFNVTKQRGLGALATGAGLYLDTPGKIDHRREVADGQVTAIYAMVSHIEKLLRMLPQQERPHYERLRSLTLAGSMVPMRLREQVCQRLTPKLYVVYGVNECSTVAVASPENVLGQPGNVGRIVPGVTVEIVDKSGAPVPPGIQGRIRIATPGAVSGYFEDDAATAKAFVDGWFHPGDLGCFTPDGQLIHLGRADDMMIIGGVNVYPAEVEECLRARPEVMDVAVMPLRHEVVQDVPVALVVLAPGFSVSPEELIDHVGSRIGRHALHSLKIADKIPRNEQGKLQREQALKIMQSMLRNDRQNEIPTSSRLARKRPDEIGVLNFNFRIPLGARPGLVADWIAVLGEQADITNEAAPSAGGVSAERDWLTQVMALARALMHVLRLPVFDPIDILDCRPMPEADGLWRGVCRMPPVHGITLPLAETVLKTAMTLAAWACDARVTDLADRNRFFSAIEKHVLGVWAKRLPSRKSTFELLKVAHQLDMPVLNIAGHDFQLGWGRKARRISGSITDHDSLMGAGWSANKLLTARLLRQAALPAPENRSVASVEQARQYAEELGFPVVIKPIDRDRGEGVTVDVTPAEIETAYERALKSSRQVLVERQVPGTCHRLCISSGRLLYAVKRLPIGVYGDGKSTIAQRVEAGLLAQQMLPPWKRSQLRPLDDVAQQMLSRQGLRSDSVVPAGVFVALRRIETTLNGGVDEDVTAIIHPDNVRAAIDAAALFGLEVAGVDMISPDITKPWHANDAVINEVNFSPLLGGGEISRRYLADHLARIVPGNGRIPIHLYLGGERAWEAARGHWQSLRETGLSCYLTNETDTLDGTGGAQGLTPCALPQRLMALLMRRDVEAIVLVIQSVQSLLQIQILDRVSTLTIVDHALASEKDGAKPLSDKNVAKLIDDWAKTLKIG